MINFMAGSCICELDTMIQNEDVKKVVKNRANWGCEKRKCLLIRVYRLVSKFWKYDYLKCWVLFWECDSQRGQE